MEKVWFVKWQGQIQQRKGNVVERIIRATVNVNVPVSPGSSWKTSFFGGVFWQNCKGTFVNKILYFSWLLYWLLPMFLQWHVYLHLVLLGSISTDLHSGTTVSQRWGRLQPHRLTTFWWYALISSRLSCCCYAGGEESNGWRRTNTTQNEPPAHILHINY